jgi:hypothetical protein
MGLEQRLGADHHHYTRARDAHAPTDLHAPANVYAHARTNVHAHY